MTTVLDRCSLRHHGVSIVLRHVRYPMPSRQCRLADAVSPIIANYKAGDCLRACVASALGQVDEVIV